MEDVKVRAFPTLADGSGAGSGAASGAGWGAGSGAGWGAGSGAGLGAGSGAGWGAGSGAGLGDGWGDGWGDGSGGLAEINGHKVYMVDGVATIFTQIHGNVAKGLILNSDLTMEPCYVVKDNSYFAHGGTLWDAMDALRGKMFEDMPEDERIAAFIQEHPDMDKAYPNQDLFDWHNRLTGSCMAGRNAFVKDHGLSLDGQTTVREFIRLTRSAYGGDIIRALDEAYNREGAALFEFCDTQKEDVI